MCLGAHGRRRRPGRRPGVPNLPVDDAAPLTRRHRRRQGDAAAAATTEGRGVALLGRAGPGRHEPPARHRRAARGGPSPVRPITDLAAATFCESVEAGHSNQSDVGAASPEASPSRKPSVRMDSQAKYGSHRPRRRRHLPAPADVQDLPARRSGTTPPATSSCARRVARSPTPRGAAWTLASGGLWPSNKGVVAAPAAIHGQVIRAVQEVLELSK